MSSRSLHLFVLAFLFCALFVFTGCEEKSSPHVKGGDSPSEGTVLKLGLVPEINIFEQRKRYLPLIEYLSEKTGLHIKMKIIESYRKVIDEMVGGDIDMAFLGSLTSAIALERGECQVLARPLWEDDISTYSGLIFARKGDGMTSDINTWRGRRLALVHTLTTAGDLFQKAYMAERGIKDMSSFFGNISYAGSHDAAIDAVLNGDADMGGAKDLVFRSLAFQNEEINNKLVILAESGRVPSNGLIICKKADEKIREKIKSVLLSMDADPEGQEVLKKFKAKKFLETNKDDYAPVYNMMKSIGIKPLDLLKVKNKVK